MCYQSISVVLAASIYEHTMYTHQYYYVPTNQRRLMVMSVAIRQPQIGALN